MMLYPGDDDLVPEHSFHRVQSALQSRASGPSIVHVYPGAQHGFTGSARLHSAVNAEAFEISWPQAVQFAVTTTVPG
jgi:carboxymethylenebutenolidase